VTAAQIGKTPDKTDDTAKSVRALPRGGEGADTPGTEAAKGATIRVFGQVEFLPNLRQNLFQQKSGVAVVRGVVLEGAIKTRLRHLTGRRDDSRIDHNGNRNRHLALMNQIVEDDRHAQLPVPVLKPAAVLKDHHTGGFRGIVLLRHIDPIVPLCAGKYLTRPGRASDRSLWYTGFRLRVRAERIVIGGVERRGKTKEEEKQKAYFFHCLLCFR
jgi:hypothetical protein